MNALRVGRIAALNMYPIYHHLQAAADDWLRFTDGVPTQLNAALLAGQLDVSAVSSIAYARHADELALLPVASIAAEGAVDSIQVFSRVPFGEVRSVAVTPHSATSVVLLRVLLGPGVPPFAELAGPPALALERYDGVLLIGDEALEGRRAALGRYATDLGAVWRERTGLPMVFAVWATRRDSLARHPQRIAALADLLTEARARYGADPAVVTAAAAERFPFSQEFIADYLGRLRYGFGPPERAGLRRFLREARAVGALAAVPRLAA